MEFKKKVQRKTIFNISQHAFSVPKKTFIPCEATNVPGVQLFWSQNEPNTTSWQWASNTADKDPSVNFCIFYPGQNVQSKMIKGAVQDDQSPYKIS